MTQKAINNQKKEIEKANKTLKEKRLMQLLGIVAIVCGLYWLVAQLLALKTKGGIGGFIIGALFILAGIGLIFLNKKEYAKIRQKTLLPLQSDLASKEEALSKQKSEFQNEEQKRIEQIEFTKAEQMRLESEITRLRQENTK